MNFVQHFTFFVYRVYDIIAKSQISMIEVKNLSLVNRLTERDCHPTLLLPPDWTSNFILHF